ncbi:MAG: type II toxin-antitoxin system CcdA family antitoxin [bacterium]
MNPLTINGKKEKVNFLFPSELNRKAIKVASELGFSYSELVRQALAEFLERIERERNNREIMEAAKFFHETEKKISDEWRVTETRLD